jgi:hypothetical protein
VHRFQLIDEQGNLLAVVLSARSSWSPGDVMPRAPREPLEVVRFVATDRDDQSGQHGYLIVRRREPSADKPTSLGEPD